MLASPPLKRQADRAAKGVAQKTVNLSEIREFVVFQPPLPLQRASLRGAGRDLRHPPAARLQRRFMKPHGSTLSRSLRITALAVTLVALLFCTSCDRQPAGKQPTGPPAGRAEETWTFWEAFNRAAVSDTGIEVLKGEEINQNVEPTLACAALEDIAAGEEARSRAITALPVLHVDPDLAAYAVEFAASRAKLANALHDYVALLKKQGEMVSGPTLGVGLLVNLLNHSDDREDGILWRAMLDQAKQTTSDLQSLKEPARAVERNVGAVRSTMSSLNTEEMAVRVKLSQRFGREFPPLVTHTNAVTQAKPSRLTEKQIVQSLIGKSAGGLLGPWRFDDAREFVSLKVLGVTNRSDVLAVYQIQTHVKGIRSGNERDLKLNLAYRWFYTRWVLIEMKEAL